jgi:hypothetical protein
MSQKEQTIKGGESILFDVCCARVGDCSSLENHTGLYFWKPGYYYITIELYHKEACQFTLFLNGTPLSGTTFGSPSASSQLSFTSIILIKACDLTTTTRAHSNVAKLEVVNYKSYISSVTLGGISGSGSIPQTTASLTGFLLYNAS